MSESVAIEQLSLSGLFDKGLNIPSYQRGYCWEKKQVEELLESLWYAERGTNYHLGTVILHGHKDIYDIVDGQQRLITLSILLCCLNEADNPLLNCKTSDLDVIKHVFNNSEIISSWKNCHPISDSDKFNTFHHNNLLFTVVTISQEDKTGSGEGYDSSLPLAWTFFNAVNSGGKLLSDYDLLKAHHLRFLSSKNRDDSLVQYKAGIWDSNGEVRVLRLQTG